MEVNSTTVLQKLESIFKDTPDKRWIEIEELAAMLGVHMPALISVLTELEHRDEIKLSITTTDGEGGLKHEGTVTLMDTPPDEREQI